MADDELRMLRHDVRGRLHNMGMCVAALNTPMSKEDQVSFVDDVIALADQIPPLLDRLLALFPAEESS
jgi:hypothetical protein